MNKRILKACLFGLLVAGISGTSALRAQDTNSAAIEKKPRAMKPGGMPFHGKLKAVDSAGNTITVGEQTIHVTPETKIFKAPGKVGTLQDGVVGEPVSGAYMKSEGGKLHATMVRFGEKEARHAKKAAATDSPPK
jgi:hypothetical protein